VRLPNLRDANHIDVLKTASSVLVPSPAVLLRYTDQAGVVDHDALTGLARGWVRSFIRDPQLPALDNLNALLRRLGQFIHLRRLQPLDNAPWMCSCAEFFKNYRCAHMLALGMAEGAWIAPPRFQNVDLLRKKKPGRPRLQRAGGRYDQDDEPAVVVAGGGVA